jgi:hypothetical protein
MHQYIDYSMSVINREVATEACLIIISLNFVGALLFQNVPLCAIALQ